MRHIATFRALVPDVDLAHWFVSQMKEHGLAPSHTKTFDNYGHNVTGKRHGKEFQVTLAPIPTDPGRVVLHVEPALGFWAGLRGRPDEVRELATKAVHDMLSGSAEVENLQWFRRKRVWQGGTATP